MLAAGLPAFGQEIPPALPVSEINRILTDPSRTAPQPARFTGTVIFVSRAGDVAIQDGTAGVIVEPPDDQPAAHT